MNVPLVAKDSMRNFAGKTLSKALNLKMQLTVPFVSMVSVISSLFLVVIVAAAADVQIKSWMILDLVHFVVRQLVENSVCTMFDSFLSN